MVWSCDKGSGGRSVEIGGGNEVPGKRKVGRPRKTGKGTMKRDLEVMGVNRMWH
jgi:hypothetical protein